MLIFLVALAPALIFGLYFYIRDKYEREPPGLLILCLILGGVITFIALFTGNFLDRYNPGNSVLNTVLYDSFINAGLNEELLKYIVFIILIWGNRNFNEKIDGIVYAVFISLGFAAVENLFYVTQDGIKTGLVRAFTAIPGHAIDGVLMGYYFSLAKFNKKWTAFYLIMALIVPWLTHGIWDTLVFLIHEGQPIGWSIGLTLWMFVAFFFLLYQLGMKQVKKFVDASPFRKNQEDRNSE